MRLQTRVALVTMAWAALLAATAQAQTLTIAAAADLQFAMQDIAHRFEMESGRSVKLVYGSSGNFFQQIQNGAPFDLFFSANVEYAQKLGQGGLAEPGSLYRYATGKIVLWVPKQSKLDLSLGLRALLSPSVRKVAIANPQHAPYGQAAVAAMRKESIYDQVSGKLVLGENISQAASFAAGGAADAGIVALALALSPNMKDQGRYVEVPAQDYPPIEQACIVVKASRNKQAAREFLRFVKTAAVSDLLRSNGFGVPGTPSN